MERVRNRGWASSDEESEDSVCSVAAASAIEGLMLFAVNVSAPVNRMNDSRREDLAAMVTAAVDEIRAVTA